MHPQLPPSPDHHVSLENRHVQLSTRRQSMQKYLRPQVEQKNMVDYRGVFFYFSSLTFSPTLFFILNCSEPFDTSFCQSQI